jgi:hypothetical protein
VAQVARIAAFSTALGSLGAFVVADVLAADDDPDAAALALALDDDEAATPVRFAGFAAVPETVALPDRVDFPEPPPDKPKRKKHKKIRFGRMDAY